MLFKIMEQQSAPEIELDVLDENPLDFHYFTTVLREALEKRIEGPHGRLTCLIKYSTDEVQDLIKETINFQLKMAMKHSKIYYTTFMVIHTE